MSSGVQRNYSKVSDRRIDDLTIIIRSVGERTEEACLQIVLSQFDRESQIHVIKDKPFAEAHIESIKLALNYCRRWSLFLDADVLLQENTIAEILHEAKSISTPFYMLNFRVLDRGFGGPTYAGVHLYSANHLAASLQFENNAHNDQKPETRMCIEMAQQLKIPSINSARLVGLHGYEQFYGDLYRTAFVRAVKHKNYFDYFLKFYRINFHEKTDDFKFMLWGLLDGRIFTLKHDKVPLDKKFYTPYLNQACTILKMQEKEPYICNQNDIDTVISDFSPTDHYLSVQKVICSTKFRAVEIPDRLIHKRFSLALSGFFRRIKKAAYILLRG